MSNQVGMTKRVFARQISRELNQSEVKRVSGGANLKEGWYVTVSAKVIGVDCCLPR